MSAGRLVLTAVAAIALSLGTVGSATASGPSTTADDRAEAPAATGTSAEGLNATDTAVAAAAGRVVVFSYGPRGMSGRVTDLAADGLCVKAKTVWFKDGQRRDVDYSPWACPEGTSVDFTERAGDASSGYFRASRIKVFKCFDSQSTAQRCNRTPVLNEPV